MVRVYATPIPAEMIEFLAGRNAPDVKLVREPVTADALAATRRYGVPVAIDAADPVPATGLLVLANLLLQPIARGRIAPTAGV
jgi:hypothetical protein